jgi:hypothetical protein
MSGRSWIEERISTLNVIPQRSFFVGVLTILLLFSPGVLLSKGRRGARVVVMLRGGGSVSGELIAVRESSIIVLDHAEADRSVDVTDISQIRVQRKKRGVGPAGIMGVVIGAACGVTYALVQSGGHGDFVMPAALPCGLLGGLLGGAIGFGVAGAGGEYREQAINFTTMTDSQIGPALARLRAQARIAH